MLIKKYRVFKSNTLDYLEYSECRLLNKLSFNLYLYIMPSISHLVTILEEDTEMRELDFLVNKNQ